MKLLLIIILFFFLIPIYSSIGNDIVVEKTMAVSNPLQNRFLMSTGTTILKGKVGGSMYTFFLIEGCYAIADYTKLHLNITQYFQKESEYSKSQSWERIGFATIISSKEKGSGDFITEGITPQTYRERFELPLSLIGVRAYRSNFIGELAFVFI